MVRFPRRSVTAASTAAAGNTLTVTLDHINQFEAYAEAHGDHLRVTGFMALATGLGSDKQGDAPTFLEPDV